ncbi:hypothetical protein ABEB36_003419 [Hypothenemus hampei]|uniref:Methylenetetrahydrofolate reductase (NAD(P)H) n=1 Tax=Hypothenemus hampei TaxID=57062 RepID=A0ABD1FC75_HYPHA
MENPFSEQYIKTILQSKNRQKISVELSPNNNIEMDILEKIRPCFVAVTWLGNPHLDTRTEDIPAVVLARKLLQHNHPVLLHLAGRNISKERMFEILTYLKSIGVKNILALQGDWIHVLEKDDSKCDFPYTSDLVLFIKTTFGNDFSVGVTGYPSVQPRSQNIHEDLKFLKLKVTNGADFIVTQAEFAYEPVESFACLCKQNDIHIPILPGIFILKSYKSFVDIAKYCAFKLPQDVHNYLERYQDDERVVKEFGLDLAINLAKKYLCNPELFAGVHIFSMNDLQEVAQFMTKIE